MHCVSSALLGRSFLVCVWFAIHVVFVCACSSWPLSLSWPLSIVCPFGSGPRFVLQSSICYPVVIQDCTFNNYSSKFNTQSVLVSVKNYPLVSSNSRSLGQSDFPSWLVRACWGCVRLILSVTVLVVPLVHGRSCGLSESLSVQCLSIRIFPVSLNRLMS